MQSSGAPPREAGVSRVATPLTGETPPASALSADPPRTERVRQSIDQLRLLTTSDLRTRYGRGGWQPVKWLIDPFALVGVYLLLVRFIFYRSPHAIGLSLACSIIPFQLLTMTISSSLNAVQLRRSILANMPFNKLLLPVSTALTETLGFGASLMLLALMMALYRVAPSLSILWLPVILAETILLAGAVAVPATLIGVWAPDLRGLMLSAVRAAYFLAPGLVTLSAVHGGANDLVRLNPLTGLFEAMRHAVLYRSAPPAWELLTPLAATAILLALFVPLYRREQAHFAKVIE